MALLGPQDRVAQLYMRHKGLGDLEPTDVAQLDDIACWYYLYDLPDGSTMELEVSYDWVDEEWQTQVVTISFAE